MHDIMLWLLRHYWAKHTLLRVAIYYYMPTCHTPCFLLPLRHYATYIIVIFITRHAITDTICAAAARGKCARDAAATHLHYAITLLSYNIAAIYYARQPLLLMPRHYYYYAPRYARYWCHTLIHAIIIIFILEDYDGGVSLCHAADDMPHFHILRHYAIIYLRHAATPLRLMTLMMTRHYLLFSRRAIIFAPTFIITLMAHELFITLARARHMLLRHMSLQMPYKRRCHYATRWYWWRERAPYAILFVIEPRHAIITLLTPLLSGQPFSPPPPPLAPTLALPAAIYAITTSYAAPPLH